LLRELLIVHIRDGAKGEARPDEVVLVVKRFVEAAVQLVFQGAAVLDGGGGPIV